MAWTDPRTWLAGETVTAALLNTHLRDNLAALGDPWASYTPTWTAASSNPAIGNGTLTGAYAQAGKLVHFRIGIEMGSTTTYGSGQWQLGLPSTAQASTVIRWSYPTVLGDSGTGTFTGVATWLSAGYLALYAPATTAGNADRVVTATAPFTWATGDFLFINGTYEVA